MTWKTEKAVHETIKGAWTVRQGQKKAEKNYIPSL